MPRRTAARGMVKMGWPFCNKRPRLHELLVGAAGKAGAGLLGAFVEDGENFFAVLTVGHFNLLAAWGDVEIIGLEHGASPAGHHGDVVGEPAHRAGLGVGFVVPFVVGDAFEGFAGVGKFLIEFS